MIYEQWLSRFTDWRPSTLYWQRLSIAERYGIEEIQTVFNEIFKEAKADYKLMTELIIVLMHKRTVECEEIENSKLCALYGELYDKANQYALSTFDDEELIYYNSLLV